MRFIIKFMTSFNKALVVICPPCIVRSMDSQGNVIFISNQTDQALNVALPTVIIQSAHSKSFHIFVHHCFYFKQWFAGYFIRYLQIISSLTLAWSYHAPKVTHSVAISNADKT